MKACTVSPDDQILKSCLCFRASTVKVKITYATWSKRCSNVETQFKDGDHQPRRNNSIWVDRVTCNLFLWFISRRPRVPVTWWRSWWWLVWTTAMSGWSIIDTHRVVVADLQWSTHSGHVVDVYCAACNVSHSSSSSSSSSSSAAAAALYYHQHHHQHTPEKLWPSNVNYIITSCHCHYMDRKKMIN